MPLLSSEERGISSTDDDDDPLSPSVFIIDDTRKSV
jgi:hypothetical protein